MSEQRTEQWHADRCGKFTGSRFADVMAVSKRDGKKLKAWSDLVWTVVVERLTGRQEEGPSAYALQWGTDVEPFAREAYELAMGNLVIESGFINHADILNVGCSPDGLVGADGGLEMKCPKDSSIHLARFISGMEESHIPQVQGCMWVTGRKWWDFVSYDPRMPENLRLYIQRIERDDAYIESLQNQVIDAEVEVSKIMQKLKEATGGSVWHAE